MMKLKISDSIKNLALVLLLAVLIAGCRSNNQKNTRPSVARQWNEAMLAAIRLDLARPTVHARNLFHMSIAMYDAWAAFDDVANPYLLGHAVGDFNCSFTGIGAPVLKQSAREEAISFAAYRLLSHRFKNSPGVAESQAAFDALMAALGYDAKITSTDYAQGPSAALGNYIAQCIIAYGLQDGANEENGYVNIAYQTVNPPLAPASPGNPDLSDPNRWQPLSLASFIDQSGNTLPGAATQFLSPEWGRVVPFSLTAAELTIYQRGNFDYWVYHDPGAPPAIDIASGGGLSSEYQWGFSLVSLWSSHLDPSDGVLWDISPGASGNVQSFPQTIPEQRTFYDALNGGDFGAGHSINPHTGEAYAPNVVPRGDYTRVLAEFWADGPDSETPPGHWFVLLNRVSDDANFEKKFRGDGPVLEKLEWDVKAYFALGGAMHDSAISAWGIKGWYDYIRPVSAIRSMADRGQSSDSNLPHYSVGGIPLEPGFVELVLSGDPLVGANDEHLNKIKLKAWRGPDFIRDPNTDATGVDWILAENWWPYQRPSFVTPPFAGYTSGHSTFSRAAAEVLTLLTGDPYFPGGVGEFTAKKNEFLVFEEGPSVNVTLQWATYRDASDQTSLSRIWGGIHPPADDIPGRIIGERIGVNAFTRAESYFLGS